MKLTSPCLYSRTSLWRWRATALNPMRSKTAPSAFGSGAAYSTNSKPSVWIGFCQRSGMAPPLEDSIVRCAAYATGSPGGVRARPQEKTRRALGHAAESLSRARQPPALGGRLDRVLEGAALRHAHAPHAARAGDPARRAADPLGVRVG